MIRLGIAEYDGDTGEFRALVAASKFPTSAKPRTVTCSCRTTAFPSLSATSKFGNAHQHQPN